jgi:Ca2+-binding RTX toxin-like protein
MTLKLTQYSWFKWFEGGERLVDTRAMLFEAKASGSPTSTHVTLRGDGYYLKIVGVDLEVNSKGRLVRGEINSVVWYDRATDEKMLKVSGALTDVASYLEDYKNHVEGEVDPHTPGMVFDASAVAAQPGGVGIGLFGADGGNDTILGSQGGEELIGFLGNDEVRGNGGDDILWGDQGKDKVFGGGGKDTLNGGDGNDLLKGEGGDDFHYGWIGKDTIEGGKGNDYAYGGAGNDSIIGGKGNDFLAGDGGNDKLDGGKGSDWAAAYVDETNTVAVKVDLNKKTITSAFGTDTLSSIENAVGGEGKDSIKGDANANKLFGYGDADTISGGAGADTLWGGNGNDKLTGGDGKDSFFFWEFGNIHGDRILDFTPGEDRILLAHSVYAELPLGKLRAENFVLGTDAQDSDDFVIYDKSTGNLYFDPDPQEGLAPGLIATLDGKPTLSVDDFKVIEPTNFDYWVV